MPQDAPLLGLRGAGILRRTNHLRSPAPRGRTPARPTRRRACHLQPHPRAGRGAAPARPPPVLHRPTSRPAPCGLPCPRRSGPEDFPGCEPFRLPAAELDRYEGRLEVWDARTETAWKVSQPTTIYHERPARRLARLAERIESLRGSRIDSFGSADLARFDEVGRKVVLVQADEALYLHPGRSRVSGPAIDVDRDTLPDVVLEVDHTTDVRRRKLGIYEAWGFPEVWVLVPPESRRRPPGLEIYLRRGGRYRMAGESAAFPGWQSEEIYLALIEGPVSSGARPALERVAREMGAREGTRPEDDPISRTIARHAEARGREEGHKEGREEGRREGHEAGRKEGREEGREEGHEAGWREAAVAVLRARGIEATPRLAGDRALLGSVPGNALMEAAVACRDEADFRRRIRAAARAARDAAR